MRDDIPCHARKGLVCGNFLKGDIMTTEKLQEKSVQYLGGDFSSRSIHKLECGLAYYNYEGIHFRVFKTLDDAKAFIKGEPAPVVAEFDSEADLDQWLEDTEICSVCGAICTINDECYEDADSGDACCTKCCFYDESDEVYRKGTKIAYGLRRFEEKALCPHCGCTDDNHMIVQEFPSENHTYVRSTCFECGGTWTARYTLDKVYTSDTEHIVVNNNNKELLQSENKMMRDFLGKQLGFSQESVSNIAKGETKLYCVHVVCDNTLRHYSLYTNKEDAQAAFVKYSKEWYSGNGVDEFASNYEYDSEVEFYENYRNSTEYQDVCDYASVSWEVLNG